MLFRDDINKIIYITSHKCGCSTISSFLMQLYNQPLTEGRSYYGSPLTALGYCTINETHKDYFKILILRDPIKRFCSALYQDCVLHHYTFGETDITIYELLLLMRNIQTDNIVDNIDLAKKISSDCKLNTHLRTQFDDIEKNMNLMEQLNFKIDKVINIENFDSEMIDIKHNVFKGKISIPKNRKNVKQYVNSYVDIVTTKVNSLYDLQEFPDITNFQEEKILNLIKTIYQKDYELIENFGIKIE